MAATTLSSADWHQLWQLLAVPVRQSSRPEQMSKQAATKQTWCSATLVSTMR